MTSIVSCIILVVKILEEGSENSSSSPRLKKGALNNYGNGEQIHISRYLFGFFFTKSLEFAIYNQLLNIIYFLIRKVI